MKNQYKSKFLHLFFIALLFLFGGCNKTEETRPLTQRGDVTGEMSTLGNPLKTKYKDNTEYVYARNVWDMHAFSGKIYFGGGNSSNAPPAGNAGLAELWSFDPLTQKFTMEYKTADEQIHRIREFDSQLYIPGHDAREDWTLGNFYRLEADGWKKYRTIPNAIHVYDIYKWGGKLFAATGTESPSTAVQVSEDGGLTWRNAFCAANDSVTPTTCNCFGRVYNLVPIANKLYAPYMTYSGKENIFTPGTSKDHFKLMKIGDKSGGRIERATVHRGQTVYILGQDYNGHQYLPVTLAAVADFEHIKSLNLPEEWLPRDILVYEKYLLVLASAKIDDNTYRNAVLAASNIDADTVSWAEVLHFTAGSFARSFEYFNGVFYFGLGCETYLLAPVTGDILSVNCKL